MTSHQSRPAPLNGSSSISEQALFPEFNNAGQPTDRLLFALYPDADAAAQISETAHNLRERHGLRGKPLETDRFHITLSHLGDFAGLPQGLVSGAIEAATRVSAPSFDVTMDRAASFAGKPGNLPFVLRTSETAGPLMDFQRALCIEMIKAGVRYKGGSQFTPHVTLLYDATSVPMQQVEPIRWTAREFVLVHSLLGKTKHVPLRRWTLREA